MKSFEYARPETEAEAIEFLAAHDGQTAVLAGGTDLLNLLKADLIAPERVVDLKGIDSLRTVVPAPGGVTIGALATLAEVHEHPLMAEYRAVLDVVENIRAIQLQHSGTVAGDLCHHPNCWYYRNGYGLLALQNGASLVAEGDNRYHAILGNQGPAKFVSASRFAPGLIAWGAKVRVLGPGPEDEEWVPLEHFYIVPRAPQQGTNVLRSGQIIAQIWIPETGRRTSATYEVLQLEGLDWPLASAAACLEIEGGTVRSAKLVMGHVAPVPWVAAQAAQALIGAVVSDDSAGHAADLAVANATPLSMNEYKVQLARTAVKRAILKAAGQWEGV